MSNAAKRQQIAAALSTIEGIHGFTARPSAPKSGDAWPQWSGSERADGWAMLNTWRIMIILDQGSDASADAAADEYGEQLVEALSAVMFVSAMAPAQLTTEGPGLYALMITGRSE